MKNTNPELLKAKLQIKHQLKYVTNQLAKVKAEFPDNVAAHNSWEGMIDAYKIALQIIDGEEL